MLAILESRGNSVSCSLQKSSAVDCCWGECNSSPIVRTHQWTWL